jgi:hypothetical protein
MQDKMKTLEFSFEVNALNYETNKVETKQAQLSFCIQAKHMTISKFSELETFIYNSELWVKVVLGFKPIESLEPEYITDDMYIRNWDKAKTAEFAKILIDLLRFFCVSGHHFLDYISRQDFDSYSDLKQLNDLFCDVYAAFNESHKPTEMQHFEHKGRRFIVPYDGALIGEALTWGEATEALQSDYFTRPNADNKYLTGALLNNTLTTIAALCREVKVIDKELGVFETKTLPPDMSEEAWAAHLQKQKLFFADLPCDIARNVGFFLTSSLVRSEATLSLALLFKSPLWPQIQAAM